MSTPTNHKVASLLREIADLLEQQNANPYRVVAYRRAASTLDQLNVDVKEIVSSKGFTGLTDLPHIGEGIGQSIYEYVAHERMTRLDILRGSSNPETLLQSVPGIGPQLARRIHHDLHIDTLEALEAAATNGRLTTLPGMGKRRVAAIKASLAQLLGKHKHSIQPENSIEPGVDLLLAIDADYRQQAKASKLPTITPKRFNPENKPWLPILHTQQAHWHFSVLFSNTARAHELHKTDDWVVLYFYDDQHHEGQHTVVTETHGPLQGKRVVRGRELECQEFYDRSESKNKLMD